MQLSPLAAATLIKFRLVYLATPYTLYPGGIELAHIDASKLAASLLRAGVRVFCPIVNCHAISIHGNLNPIDHEFWMNVDRGFMSLSDALVVGMLNGWRKSRGIKEEIEFFFNKPIFFLDPSNMELDCDSNGPQRQKEYADLHRGSGLLSSGSIGNS